MSDAETTAGGAKESEVAYKQIESIYHAFQCDLRNAFFEAQRRCACAATMQQPIHCWSPFTAVNWGEIDLPRRYGAAFREYRSQVQKFLSGVDLNKLNSVALMAVAQSIELIARYGLWLNDPTVAGCPGPEKPPEKAAGTPSIGPDPSRQGGRQA